MLHLFMAGMLLLLVGASPPILQAAPFTLVEKAKVPNDRAEILLLREVIHRSKNNTVQLAEQLVDWVSSYRYNNPKIRISIVKQEPAVYCYNRCEEKQWLVRVKVLLQGQELDQLRRVAATLLKQFTFDHIRFKLSPRKRSHAELLLIARAEERFAVEAPLGGEYDAIQINSQNTSLPSPNVAEELEPGYSIISVTLTQY